MKLWISLFCVLLLFSCEKGRPKKLTDDTETIRPNLSYHQENPYIHIEYNPRLLLIEEKNKDESWQMIRIEPGEIKAAQDLIKVELQYSKRLPRIQDGASLLAYLQDTYPDRTWSSSTLFRTDAGYFTAYADPNIGDVEMYEYYLMSDKNEVFHLTYKPGKTSKYTSYIQAAWSDLQLQLKQTPTQ